MAYPTVEEKLEIARKSLEQLLADCCVAIEGEQGCTKAIFNGEIYISGDAIDIFKAMRNEIEDTLGTIENTEFLE